MQTINFPNPNELKKHKSRLEKTLNVKIQINNKEATIEGQGIEEYEASIVLEAMAFGFSADKALQLQNQDMIFRIIPIKALTRRKNLEEVRSRIIGKKGKTKETIQEIADCDLILNNNEVGLICHAENSEEATAALTNLIKGSKQTNVYRYLESGNRKRKKEQL
ncbi:hypothetical protein CMI48_03890 [Candidatus Pacearchaeota archaeon]|nr:hypothetical protein [Candidatus Pacearchaeota archaeon]